MRFLRAALKLFRVSHPDCETVKSITYPGCSVNLLTQSLLELLTN